MTKKLILGVLGASMILGFAVPAHAQNDRSRSNNQNSSSSYSQNLGNSHQNARYNQRGNDSRRIADHRTAAPKVFQTRFRARIILTEDIIRSRRGASKVCTVSVMGPQARLVPKKRLRKIARDNCSRRAKIRISTRR